ncbi:MAG: EamA family transporter [Elusimicrobia bacterium]|nr:EamA family transporter [Candidatus Liberimonas magnetica]
MEKTTILLVLLTIVFWGIAPILDKAALKNASPMIGLIVRGLSIGLFMLAALVTGKNIKNMFAIPSQSMIYFIISGLLAGVLGTFTFYKALQMDYTSRIVPIVATYPLITALLSVIFLGEALSLPRIVGIILIIAGIILVK